MSLEEREELGKKALAFIYPEGHKICECGCAYSADLEKAERCLCDFEQDENFSFDGLFDNPVDV